jgi:hypothetical protein
MPVLFVQLGRLFATSQKTLILREETLCFASKPHPPAHQNATLWVSVVPMPFCRYRRLSSVVPFSMWGIGGVYA